MIPTVGIAIDVFNNRFRGAFELDVNRSVLSGNMQDEAQVFVLDVTLADKNTGS